ncbi:unnamed protein product [Rhizoctonia solani]|uniref:Uncharacterized protein n=1 Tax=Rhizoctonia solani TaxID=456999 RepID=A0A8H3E6B6_9AGAM|nr:unnamed protein product [Rhizoctonia solani]
MPGWWFPVEFTPINHMLSQFTKTIKLASTLKSTEEERATLRARSALQHFSVIKWRQYTEDFTVVVSMHFVAPPSRSLV